MKEETRKEIEEKWHQLVTQASEKERIKSTPKTMLIGAKIIRRRKGQADLSIP